MVSIREQADKILAEVTNTPGGSAAAAAAALGLALCAYLLLRSSRENINPAFRGLKELPTPKGAVPYLGKAKCKYVYVLQVR